MTYNTRIYNYANLDKDDKHAVQAQLLLFECIETQITEYTYSKEDAENLLEQISYEEGLHALQEAQQNVYNEILDFMQFAIESYERPVSEIDTDDPFYGLEEELNMDEEEFENAGN